MYHFRQIAPAQSGISAVRLEPVGSFFNLRGLFLLRLTDKARKTHTLLIKALSQLAQLLGTPVYWLVIRASQS